jgi:hypothetical protein
MGKYSFVGAVDISCFVVFDAFFSVLVIKGFGIAICKSLFKEGAKGPFFYLSLNAK